MAQHQRNSTIAAAACSCRAVKAGSAPNRPGSQCWLWQCPERAGWGRSVLPPGSQQVLLQQVGLQGQQANSQPITQQLLQQQMSQLAQQYRQGQAMPPASVQQNKPP